jgi:Ras-related protein Rab-21|eukprot:g669.t1
MPRSRTKKYKVVLLGEGRVGKTSILIRFCQNNFDDRQQPTLQASYLDKKLNVDQQSVHLSIWDTAGQERFHALGPIYYRDADAALLVYDITDGDSLGRVRKWVQELKRHASSDIVMAIAGNKCDLEKRRVVKKQDALDFAKSVGATHFDTSAKLGRGLNESFLHLARGILAKSANDGGALTLGSGGGRKRGGKRGSAAKTVRIREDSIDESSTGGKSGGGKGCC